MLNVRKIATNIPSDLLTEATKLTGLNQTQALIEGLKELIAREKRMGILNLRGKLHFDNHPPTRKRKRTRT
jgi:hypothetical protein